MYDSSLFLYIMDYVSASHMHNFMQLSTEHCNIVLDYCIRKYISRYQNRDSISHILVQILRTTFVPETIRVFVRSHLSPFISRREPFLPVFRSCFNKVCARDLLGSRDSISPRVLLHMDQCMYNYSSGSDGDNADMVIAEMLNIANTYITREDIRDVQDIQSHHRYVILKASELIDGRLDRLMAEIFTSPLADNLELVIDCEGNCELLDMCHKNVLPDKFGLSHRIQDISIMGNNLRTTGKLTTVGDTIRSIVIPHGVTDIGNWCISICPNLTSISIPDTVTSIRDYFFQNVLR
jgi:hypothetical protein